jgi:hypothetical protein
MMTHRLTRIDITTLKPIKETWNKAGDLARLSDGVQVGQIRQINWGQSYQVWPGDGFYPFNLRWKPVPWFPPGKVQFWEYTGELSNEDLLKYSQLDDSNPNADILLQIEMLKQSIGNSTSIHNSDGYDNPELPLVQCVNDVQPSFDEEFE